MKTKSRSSRICKSCTLFSFVAICMKSIELQFSHAYNLQIIIISKYALLKYFLIFWGHSFMQKRKKKFHGYSILCKYVVLEGAIKRVGCFEAIFCGYTYWKCMSKSSLPHLILLKFISLHNSYFLTIKYNSFETPKFLNYPL